MRRRVWAYIRMADILFSFQAGLPSMVRVRVSDANLPRNIHDDTGFHETCLELPPARPDSEITHISFLVIKTRLVSGFARALKEMNRPTRVAYERVLEVDRELRDMYDNVPEYYKLYPLSQTGFDPLPIIASRFMLANIHHKSLCVVHSRYLEAARMDSRYIYSRRACLESAMRLLSFQAIQHNKSSASGGRQATARYQTSLTTHDFLLGATIVCAELSLDKDPVGIAQRKDTGPSRAELLAALERSARIWHHMRDHSMEAYKASDVLGMLSLKFQRQTDTKTQTKSLRNQNSRNRSENSLWGNYRSRDRIQDGDCYQDRGNKPEENPPPTLARSDIGIQWQTTSNNTTRALTETPSQLFGDFGTGLPQGQSSEVLSPPDLPSCHLDSQAQIEGDWVSDTFNRNGVRLTLDCSLCGIPQCSLSILAIRLQRFGTSIWGEIRRHISLLS